MTEVGLQDDPRLALRAQLVRIAGEGTPDADAQAASLFAALTDAMKAKRSEIEIAEHLIVALLHAARLTGADCPMLLAECGARVGLLVHAFDRDAGHA